MSETADMAWQPGLRSHGKKLFGRAFYESLGSPKYVLAPMVDQSEFAWRMLTRSFLPANSSKKLLAYSPMLHSRLFAEVHKYRNHHFEPLRASFPVQSDSNVENEDLAPESSDYKLDGNPAIDRPLFVQFCSNSPSDLLQAAKLVEPFCDAVDLNLGCPQGIAKKGNYGAFLQEDWDLIYRLINTLHTELSIPVTAKMRILDTKERTLDYAKMILSAGASIITVHGRRREQKGHNTGLADWSVIRYLRENLPSDTVIFANGNILQHDDIEQCLAATRADGVMSAEANLNDPTIFAEPPPVGQEGREYWRGRDGKGGYRMDAVLRRYLDIVHKHVLEHDPPSRPPLFVPSDPIEHIENVQELEDTDIGEPPNKKRKQSKSQKKDDRPVNLRVMQPHLFSLLRPLVSKHTDIRDILGRTPSGDINEYEIILGMVERVVKQGIIDYENSAQQDQATEAAQAIGASDMDERSIEHDHAHTNGVSRTEELDPSQSSLAAIERCRRPWWVCQPHIRPLPKEAFEKGAMQLSKKQKKKLAQQERARAAQAARPKDTQSLPPNATPNGNPPQKPPTGDGQADESNVPIPQEGLVCG